MMRLPRLIGRIVAVVSVAAIAVAIALARPAAWPIAAVVVLLMAWGSAPQAIDAFLGKSEPSQLPPDAHGSFTIAVHVGRQSPGISRVGVAAAVAAAPTVVVATDAACVDLLGPLSCPIFIADTVEQALNDAAATIVTDALFVLSASSFADVRGADAAAGLIRDGAGWVIGHSPTFNRDGFSPLVRGRLGTRLRSSARAAGLQLWEPNATIVSTRVVRQQPFQPGRPWGAMLRTVAGRGVTGSEQNMTFSMTAEPVDARSYWPASVVRRRRSVADLADAVATSRGRSRWLAIGLLLRELDGCLLALWLISPWLFTRAPLGAFRCPLWVVVVLAGLPACLRWMAARFVHRVSVHPLEDMLALAFDAPGSVLAVPAAFTRRVAPTRVRLPGQPLVVAGLVFALITCVPLFTEGTTAERSAAVGLALTELALLWLLAMRAIFQRNWTRTTYRVRAPLSVRIDGRPATTLDVSPRGLALEGSFGELPIGSEVAVDISLDDGSTLSARGTIEDRRTRRSTAVAGVSLRVPSADQSRWVVQLSHSVVVASSHVLLGRNAVHTAAVPHRQVATKWLGRLIAASIAAVSLMALLALGLSVVGYRPLIVSSGSMEPALRVGDVVLVEDVEARQLKVGDVATLRDPLEVADTLTHRVRAISDNGQVVVVTTRGDANTADETFTMQPTAIVGRIVTRFAAIGTFVAWAGNPRVRWIAAVVGVGTIAVLAARRQHRRPTAGAGLQREKGHEVEASATTMAATPATTSAPAATSTAS
jgi:signal peptidase I